MATVYRENRKTPARQYISTAAFDQYLWTYTVTTDPNTFVQTGTFALVAAANATNCPRGRILRENGERLYPGQSNVNTLMVKVFDSNSGLSGYIDPNAEVFALYNADRPISAVDGFENNGTSTVHRGPSMFTSGNVLADGNLNIGGTADISGALRVASGGATITAGGLTVTAGRITLPTTAGASAVGTVTANGTTSVVVNNTLVTANSIILLSLASAPSGVTSSTAYVFARAANTSFTIRAAAGDVSTYNYLIVN